MNNKYDIFISYRRDGGAQFARILQLMLMQRGYKVFLDYDELTDGVFSDKIKDAISAAPVFMIVLSKGAMARCVNENDWVRKEISLAVEQQKHIIPVNPDNAFDGFPNDMPDNLREAIGSHQHSEISFGQALGVTIDLMIKNRLEPTLGVRTTAGKRDEDFDAAKLTLQRQDAHNRFMRRLAIFATAVVTLIVLATCLLLWRARHTAQQQQQHSEALAAMRADIEQRHAAFMPQLSTDLSEEQLGVIDTMLTEMTPIYEDSVWMSQFEFRVGQWHTILAEPYDVAEKDMPMTSVTFADISMLLIRLYEQTGISFALPSTELWQYAAHAGKYQETTTYSGSDEPDKVAWFADNSGAEPHPSDGQQGKEPNSLDLFDMSGNVAEFCNTPYGDSGLYTICGGSYDSPADDVTVNSQKGFDTNAKSPTVGFRVIIVKTMRQ